MRETTKAMRRRERERVFVPKIGLSKSWKDIFAGQGLDVGSGDDPLLLFGTKIFDLPDGGGDDLRKSFKVGDDGNLPAAFDFIHGSNVLEHMRDPVLALNSWLALLKPGGYIIFTVPDFDLYEGNIWPSRFNAGHRSSWSLTIRNSSAPIHVKLPKWLEQFPVEVLRCDLVTTNYDFSKVNATFFDQTFDAEAGVEACIEVVLKKR